MKRWIISFILMLCLLTCIVGCNKADAEEPTEETIIETIVIESSDEETTEESEEVTQNATEEIISNNYDENNIYNVAYDLYGMSETNVIKALKLITYEGYGADGYLDYLMACTVINHYLANPAAELYSNWGGGDNSYNESTFANVGIADHAYTALWRRTRNRN